MTILQSYVIRGRIWKSRDDPTRQSLFFFDYTKYISTHICIFILLYFTTLYSTGTRYTIELPVSRTIEPNQSFHFTQLKRTSLRRLSREMVSCVARMNLNESRFHSRPIQDLSKTYPSRVLSRVNRNVLCDM
jgi:hypothetical protein